MTCSGSAKQILPLTWTGDTPGELQRRNASSGPVRAATPVLLSKGQVLHAGPAVQNFQTLTLHELLDLADVPGLEQQLNGSLQDLEAANHHKNPEYLVWIVVTLSQTGVFGLF